jgi:hypothetical protein
MMKYAENTSVSSDKSQQEIQRTLRRYGADEFAYGWTNSAAMVGFVMNGRQIKFLLPMPDPKAKQFTHTPTRGTLRSEAQAFEEYDKAVRQRWRALNLVIKAKLEAVESGITTFDEEFLAHIVMPDGQTVAAHVLPNVQRGLAANTTPRLLAIEA